VDPCQFAHKPISQTNTDANYYLREYIWDTHLSDYHQTPLIVEGVAKKIILFFLFHGRFSPLREKYFEKEIFCHKLLTLFQITKNCHKMPTV
jgi:hypothetical protein